MLGTLANFDVWNSWKIYASFKFYFKMILYVSFGASQNIPIKYIYLGGYDVTKSETAQVVLIILQGTV